MSGSVADDAGGDAVNDLFKHDHGITQARRKLRNAEAKCRLMLKRALKQGDIRFCNSCISSFANDGMLGLALVIVREVFEKGKFKPTEYTLSNVINACIRCSEIDRALHHWKSLQTLGATANEVTYTALFKGLCSSNRLDDALAMLQEMQAAGLRPNERTFSTLMRGCMRDARGDAAQVVLLQMQQNGVSPDGPCLEYAVKALVYDGELKAASKLCKLHARDITAAAAVVLATGWAVAGERKKAAKAAALAREKLAPGNDAKLNPFKKAEAGNSHEMYSVHQASELQRDLERIDDEVKRIKSGVAGAEACKSMRRSPRVLFVRGGSSSAALDRDHLLSRFPARLSAGELCIEAGSGYGEWVVHTASQQPQQRWVAVELRADRIWASWSRACMARLDNVVLVCGSGADVLQLLVGDGAAAAVHCNYPEPPVWSGSSCHLVNADFIAQCSRVLSPGGSFEMLTDDASYAASVVRTLVQSSSKALSPANGRHFSTSQSHGAGESYFDRLWQNGSKTQRYTIAWERVSDGKAKRKGQAKDEADAGQRSKKKARADADAEKNK